MRLCRGRSGPPAAGEGRIEAADFTVHFYAPWLCAPDAPLSKISRFWDFIIGRTASPYKQAAYPCVRKARLEDSLHRDEVTASGEDVVHNHNVRRVGHHDRLIDLVKRNQVLRAHALRRIQVRRDVTFTLEHELAYVSANVQFSLNKRGHVTERENHSVVVFWVRSGLRRWNGYKGALPERIRNECVAEIPSNRLDRTFLVPILGKSSPRDWFLEVRNQVIDRAARESPARGVIAAVPAEIIMPQEGVRAAGRVVNLKKRHAAGSSGCHRSRERESRPFRRSARAMSMQDFGSNYRE